MTALEPAMVMALAVVASVAPTPWTVLPAAVVMVTAPPPPLAEMPLKVAPVPVTVRPGSATTMFVVAVAPPPLLT